jgi:hypothetical protein
MHELTHESKKIHHIYARWGSRELWRLYRCVFHGCGTDASLSDFPNESVQMTDSQILLLQSTLGLLDCDPKIELVMVTAAIFSGADSLCKITFLIAIFDSSRSGRLSKSNFTTLCDRVCDCLAMTVSLETASCFRRWFTSIRMRDDSLTISEIESLFGSLKPSYEKYPFSQISCWSDSNVVDYSKDTDLRNQFRMRLASHRKRKSAA